MEVALGVFLAMFRSEGVIPEYDSASSLWASGSEGVGRSDRGRFPRTGRGMFGGGGETGDGERDGSFSLNDDSRVSSSSETSGSA